MMDGDLSDIGKDVLAFLAGVGIFGIILFFYFFMLEDAYENIYVMTFILILLATMMIFFYLFDELGFIYMWAFTKDETGDLKDKLRRWTNLIAGMLLMGIVMIILIAFTQYGFDHGFRVTVVTFLTSFSVFLFLFSLFMEG